MAEVNLKNVQCERSDQENEEDGSYSSKIEQRAIQRDSSPKRGKSLKKRKTRKRRRASSSSQSRSPSRRRKKRSKKQSKKQQRRKSSSSSSSLSSSHSQSPGGSILYQMKINLNWSSRLSFHPMQTHSLRNTSQRKAFTTQSVKYIPYQTT